MDMLGPAPARGVYHVNLKECSMSAAAPAPAPAGVDYPGKTLGIVGLILSIVVGGLPGLIVSAIALNQSKKAGYKNTIALVGLIIGIVVTVFYVLLFVIIGIASAAAISSGATY
jgi:hypothetical protein